MKYPEIEVQLTGEDGNALSIIGRVRRALNRGGVSREEQDEFQKEALSGDYNHVLSTCQKWVNCL